MIRVVCDLQIVLKCQIADWLFFFKLKLLVVFDCKEVENSDAQRKLTLLKNEMGFCNLIEATVYYSELDVGATLDP